MISFPVNERRQPKVDWLMILAILGLMIIGTLFVYSATMANESAALTPWHKQAWEHLRAPASARRSA